MNGARLHFVKAVNEYQHVSESAIDDLLDLIQAPPTLQSIYHLIPLLPEVLEAAATIAEKSDIDAGRFRGALATADQLASVVVELVNNRRYKEFRIPDPMPRFGPCGGLLGSHPLYSALAEIAVFKNTHKRFVYLKAQILLAMESLGTMDQELQDLLHVPFTTFRDLTKQSNEYLLKDLPDSPVPVSVYAAIVMAVFRKTKLQPVCKIFEIAENPLRRKKRIKKKTTVRKPGLPQFVREDDEDPAAEYLEDSLPSTTLSQKELEDYTDHGGLPDELGSDIDLEPVLATDRYHGPTWRQLTLQAQQAHNRRAMLNQFCAMAWNQANLLDLKILFEFLDGRNQLDDFDYQPLTREDVIVILGLMFFTSKSLERVLLLPVFPGCDPRPDSGEGVYQRIGHPVQVQLRSSGPDLSGPRVLQGAIPVVRYSVIQLPPFFSSCLEQIGNPLSTGTLRPRLIDSIDPADETSQHSVLSTLRGVMGRLNSGSGVRLSLGRVSSYLLFRVADAPHSDLPGAMLYFGRNDKFARTRIHYTLADSRQLGVTYRACTNTLLDGVGCSGQFSLRDQPRASVYLGTPFCPEEKTVRRLAEKLQAKLDEKSLSMVDRHNYVALYTSMLISFGTGYRAIHDPSFREMEIDPQWGLGVIADKGSADYRTRYVYLAPVVLDQITYYREHMQVMYARLGVVNPSLFSLVKANDCEGVPLNLFWLAGDVEPLELLTPGKVRKILRDEFDYAIPVNAGRHYLKYHLIKAGCSPELVEAQLGHWEAGQEPWGPFSNLDLLDFTRQMGEYIPKLLECSGWRVLDRSGR